jgi:hypothetical protein
MPNVVPINTNSVDLGQTQAAQVYERLMQERIAETLAPQTLDQDEDDESES